MTKKTGFPALREEIEKRPKKILFPSPFGAKGRVTVSGRKVMKPSDPNWERFKNLLSGPQGLNFRQEDGETKHDCDQSWERPFARKILASYFPGYSIEKSLKFFEKRGGMCDCEIIWNVS
jgi:hypothetical protein